MRPARSALGIGGIDVGIGIGIDGIGVRVALILFAGLCSVGCKGAMAKIDAVRDALIADDGAAIDKATAGYPTCADAPPAYVPPDKPNPRDTGCLAEIANALGSQRGFVADPPDHAAATTAALVLLRDGRGDWLAHPDAWLADVKAGKGAGHDALRLAMAKKMADAAPVIGRHIEDDASARAAMKAVAGAVPGACPTYWLLGSSAPNVPPELDADHSACVQRDLARRDGPGGTYGTGTLRAVEGALSLWRDSERALRIGLSSADPGPKATLEKKLAIIEAATLKIETKKLPPSPPNPFLGEAHADAGVPIFRIRDAGGADAR